MRLAIVCLHYHHLKDTIACLTSLKKNLEGVDYKIFLVNNNPLEKICKKDLPQLLELIEAGANLGFSGGNNLGIKQSLDLRPDYVLLINNDALVKKGFLTSLVDIFQKDPKAGLVAPAIVHYRNGRKQYGLEGHINRWLGICRHRNLNYLPKKEIRAEFVSGCCLLIKKDVFVKVGFLPEQYFLYFEDVDYCLQVKKAGFRIYLQPQSLVFHKQNRSFKEDINNLILNFKSNLVFVSRWFPWPNKIIAFLYLIIFYPGLIIIRLLRS